MTTDTAALRELLARATPDAPHDRPGDLQVAAYCENCGVFFTGSPEHSLCGKCSAYMELKSAAINVLPALLDELDAARRDAEFPARYFASGPHGEFWTDRLDLANRLIAAIDPAAEDWTLTDTAINAMARDGDA